MTIEVAAKPVPHRAYHIMHLRERSPHAVQDSANNTIPAGTITPNGGLTIAFKVAPFVKETGWAAVQVTYGVAICSPLDRYERKKGRELAMFRADMFKEENPLLQPATSVIPEANILPDAIQVLDEYAESSGLAGCTEAAEFMSEMAHTLKEKTKAGEKWVLPALTKKDLVLNSSGRFVVDLPDSVLAPSSTDALWELTPSRFLHVAIVKASLEDLRLKICAAKDQFSRDMYWQLKDCLDIGGYSELTSL